MSRLRRIADRDRIFFITTNLAKRVAPLAPSERDIVVEILAAERTRGVFLFGYVVMANHVHLLVNPYRDGMIAFMRHFKRQTTLELKSRGFRSGPIWQPRYFDFILRRARDFTDKIAYIHDNPVAAGIVTDAREYVWSSASAYFGATPQRPIEIDRAEMSSDGNALLWHRF